MSCVRMAQSAKTGSGVSFGTDEETELILQSLDEFVEQEVKADRGRSRRDAHQSPARTRTGRPADQ